MRTIAGKAKKPEWAEANDIANIVDGVRTFAEGPGQMANLEAADKLFRSAVEHWGGLTSHVARAAFLRKTGRNQTADLEVRVSAEFVMQQPNAEFEVSTEESRNEVLFSKNLALKLNADPEPLNGEFSLLEKLRREFGQSIIYPIQVYRRGESYYLPSERGPETLLEQIRQRKARFEDFAQALAQLVQIQRFGMELHVRGELNFDDAILRIDLSKPETMYFANRRARAIGQIEKFNGIKLPESYRDSIIRGLAFVDAELASSRILTMYSDRGPKNWLKQLFGHMQALDFEPSSLKLLPPQMDLVNLLEFAEYLSPQSRRRLIDLYIAEYEKEHHIKVNRQEFLRKYEFAGLQWHYERLIYNPEEASRARTAERQEAKKKEQIYHLAKAREHLDTIVERGYVEGKDLEAALRAQEELKRPIFADANEWQSLEDTVKAEMEKVVLKEALPMSPAKRALVASAVPALLALSTIGFLAVRNNLVPVANVPVFSQGDKVMLSISEKDRMVDGVIKSSDSQQLYVINADNNEISFLTTTDNFLNVHLSRFQDKLVFIRDGHTTLYDFIKKEFRIVEDKRFRDPSFSNDGLWVASTVKMEYRSSNMSGIWFIRPSDMKTREMISTPNSFLPPWSGNSWSPDGTYLVFLSNNELNENGTYPNDMKVWINVLNLTSGKTTPGPFISDNRRGVFTWSPNGLLAYVNEGVISKKDGVYSANKDRVYISDPEFKNPREVYVAGKTQLGEEEWVTSVEFVGTRHLLILSRTLKSFDEMVLLNLENNEALLIRGSSFERAAKDGNRFLYRCNSLTDICEFDVRNGTSRNLTNTPKLRETIAVYSPDQKKIYVVAYPKINCITESCPPSLFAISLPNGAPVLLQKEKDGDLRYNISSP